MSNLPFPPELRTASIVPRWSIVWTLNKDYLTNHSFFVTMYAHDIAEMIGWNGHRAALMYLAMTHDLDETITGDIVSPVKPHIVDPIRSSNYIDTKLMERMPSIMRYIEGYKTTMLNRELDDAYRIITVADRLDALLFIITEQRLGNTVIGPRAPDALARLEAAWRDLPYASGCKSDIDDLWHTAVLPSINAHKGQGGFGV